MNRRLEALVNRGYSKEDVIRLSSFSDNELEYAMMSAFRHISRNSTPVNNPVSVFIGGQPGCGKTVMSSKIKDELENAIEIGIDNYRMYHPNYLKIEKCIKEHWKDREENINDTPGNDIADFTHEFAGIMTDRLIEYASKNKYNLILEWGMREPSAPLECMSKLKKKGYKNIVLFVGTYKDVSYNACNLRSDGMKNSVHIIRKVPKSFHDYCIDTLPDSIDNIYNLGFKNNLIDDMKIINRDNEVLWNNDLKNSPKEIYIKCLNDRNYSNSIDNSEYLANKSNKREMLGLIKEIDYLKKIRENVVYTDNNINVQNNVSKSK